MIYRPEASIKFDTYHIDGRTIIIATVPESDKRPVCALDEEGQKRAYSARACHVPSASLSSPVSYATA